MNREENHPALFPSTPPTIQQQRRISRTEEELQEFRGKFAGFGIPTFPVGECKIDFTNQLGVGGQMEVYGGTISNGGIEVAFKIHRKKVSKNTSKTDLDCIYKAIGHDGKLMHRIQSAKNVVNIYGLTFDGNNPVLIVERGWSDLGRYLEDARVGGSPVSWIEKASFCIDIVAGVKTLHESDIIHGDLKVQNIIVFMDDDGSKTAKISDLGYSFSMSSVGKHGGGTLASRAPECSGITSQYPDLAGFERKPEQDIYGIGIVVQQIARDGDFDPENQMTYIPDDAPEGIQSVIISATKFFPKERASIDEIQHILEETKELLLQC